MSAAYGVQLGGALFSLELMRGVLALRYVLPALAASIVATGVGWIWLPDAPTYVIPAHSTSASIMVAALVAGPIIGVFSVWYVKLITWAERHKPERWRRMVVPLVGLGILGAASIRYPQLLGNGKDASQLAFTSRLPILLLAALVVLKPAATILCVRCGAPGGLFTPSLTAGAMLGGVLGYAWSLLWPGVPPDLLAILGAARGTGRDYAGSHFLDGSTDGTDRAQSIVCPATSVSGHIRNPGCAIHRTALDLRRPLDEG